MQTVAVLRLQGKSDSPTPEHPHTPPLACMQRIICHLMLLVATNIISSLSGRAFGPCPEVPGIDSQQSPVPFSK